MTTVSKQYLSGSTTGQPISVVATATPGTTVHAGHASSFDEVWLYACNTHTALVTLTIEYGGSTANIKLDMSPNQGLMLVLPGSIITNATIRAYAGTTAVIYLVGWVNRIT